MRGTFAITREIKMKRFVVAILLAASCLACLGAASSGRLRFRDAAFSIQPLEAAPGRIPYQVLMMFLPPSDGFAPNVNVLIQPYAGTIDDYTTLSKSQFLAAGYKMISETKQGAAAVLFEYSGKFQGRELHWYSKATSSGTTVYLATATATEDQWRSLSGQLKACVDSLAVDKGAPAHSEDE